MTTKLVKTAQKYRVRLAQLFSKVFQGLQEAAQLSQNLSFDIYDEQDPNIQQGLKEIERLLTVAADKAYKEGLSASSLNYFLDKVKTRATLLLSLDMDETTKKDLTELYSKVSNLQLADIPVQKPAPKQAPAETMSFESEELLDPSLKDLANQMADKDLPSSGLDLGPNGTLRTRTY